MQEGRGRCASTTSGSCRAALLGRSRVHWSGIAPRWRPPNVRNLRRLLEILISGSALVVLAPLLCAIAAVIRFTLRGTPLFVQPRIGINERIFAFYKFRTMTGACDPAGKLLPDEQRLTGLGRFL